MSNIHTQLEIINLLEEEGELELLLKLKDKYIESSTNYYSTVGKPHPEDSKLLEFIDQAIANVKSRE